VKQAFKWCRMILCEQVQSLALSRSLRRLNTLRVGSKPGSVSPREFIWIESYLPPFLDIFTLPAAGSKSNLNILRSQAPGRSFLFNKAVEEYCGTWPLATCYVLHICWGPYCQGTIINCQEHQSETILKGQHVFITSRCPPLDSVLDHDNSETNLFCTKRNPSRRLDY
jgi:hypothetical protein